MNNNIKSATTAGLLGIFLGAFGAHDWYLGNKKKGIIHVCLAASGLLVELLASFLLPSVLTFSALLRMGWLITILNGVAALVMAGNSIWGLVEGITILTQGDAGLARKGYAVAGQVVGAQGLNGQAANVQAAQASAEQNVGGQPYGSQATVPIMQQPMNTPKPQKQPMNPATKKKIIKYSVIGVCAVVMLAVAGVVISIVTRVDYGPAYNAAKELRTKVRDINSDSNCQYAVEYVDSAYTSDATYSGYVEKCKLLTDDVDDLINKLGDTAGVKRNKEIENKFQVFKTDFYASMPDAGALSQKLDLYVAWHKYTVLLDSFTISKLTEAELTNAASILINSGNETLKDYGEGWLEITLAYLRAYQAYEAASYTDPNKSTLRNERDQASSAQRLWVSQNKPSIKTVAPIELQSTTKMYSDFNSLYSLISDAYEEHYNKDSGDCTEFLGEVVCD